MDLKTPVGLRRVWHKRAFGGRPVRRTIADNRGNFRRIAEGALKPTRRPTFWPERASPQARLRTHGPSQAASHARTHGLSRGTSAALCFQCSTEVETASICARNRTAMQHVVMGPSRHVAPPHVLGRKRGIGDMAMIALGNRHGANDPGCVKTPEAAKCEK
jgi:hypothetical protein